jgi:hypothetical protein
MVEDEDGNMIRDMFMYTAYGRLAHDWEAVVMPRPVYDLGVFLWKAAFPLLTLKSQAHPPNGCQLLLYYTAFNSCMGRHRDNYNSKQMAEVLAGRRSVCELVEGNHHGGDANSQLVGSHVLVYTEGDADMNFALAFAPKNNPTAVLDDYIITPQFCTKLGAGTLLVFSPVDDLFFTHEAWFFDTDGQMYLSKGRVSQRGTIWGHGLPVWTVQPRPAARLAGCSVLPADFGET